jgi:hypothetical protein
MMAVPALRDMTEATSAAHERGPHIIDVRSGKPARGFASVWVIAAELPTADALVCPRRGVTVAKAFFLGGNYWAADGRVGHLAS